MSCEDCPLSLSCWSGALLGKERSRVGYAKDVKDRAVWQESVTLCPVCEKLCVITYKHHKALEALEEGLYAHALPMLSEDSDFYVRGVNITAAKRRLDNGTSSPLDGQDFTLERHHCEGRTLNEQGWAVWYNGFYQEGPLYVVREDDSAPSAHPGDHIWVKICPLCLRAYLNKLSMDAKHEGLYLAPRSVVEFNTMQPSGKHLVDAMLATKRDNIPGWGWLPSVSSG